MFLVSVPITNYPFSKEKKMVLIVEPDKEFLFMLEDLF